jgi:polysaccharide chain length determinant protein (PEP-CTERM system associated)
MLELARNVWHRRKWLAILVFVVPLTAATGVVAFIPNLYESTATVLVDRQQIPEVFVRPTVTSELETHLRTISHEILSRSRLDSIINRFGLYAKLRTVQPYEAVIERMRSDIRLDLTRSDLQRRDSMIAFAISYRGFDPDTVAQVTNMLASSYVEENLKVRERQATGTAEFLRVQLQQARERLDDQERQVSQFKRRNLGELPQQIEIDRLDAQLRMNIDNQTRQRERRETLAKREAQMLIISDDRSGGRGDKLGLPPESPGETLARMERELRQLRIRYTDKHPDVVRVRIAIAELEKELSESPPPAVMATREARTVPHATTNPYLGQLGQAQDEIDGELRALTAEEKRLRASIDTYVSRVKNAPKVEQELQELSRDYESTKERYASLSKHYEEAQLAETMVQRQKGEQFRILDPARRSAGPAAPNRRRLLFVAGVLSLGLAVGAVVVAEALDTSFHSRETLRSFTTVRVIGLPRILLDTDVRRQRWQFCLGAIGTTLVLVVIVGISYYFAHGNDRLVRW